MTGDNDKSGAVQSIRNMASNSVARLYGGKKNAGAKDQDERPAAPPPRVRAEEDVHVERAQERQEARDDSAGAQPGDAMEVVADGADTAPAVPARPPAKAIVVAVAVLVAVGVLLVRACSSDPAPKVESAAKPSTGQWKQFEPNEVRPLAPIDPKAVPGLVAGVDREHQLSQRVSSISRPIEVPPPIKIETPAPSEPENSKIQVLEQKVQTLTKELEVSRKEAETARAQRVPKVSAKKVVAKLPSVKVMAIARTEGCLTCPVLALLDVDGVAQQVGSGDKIKDYTVSVASDRVVLSRNKEQHVFYSLTPPQ